MQSLKEDIKKEILSALSRTEANNSVYRVKIGDKFIIVGAGHSVFESAKGAKLAVRRSIECFFKPYFFRSESLREEIKQLEKNDRDFSLKILVEEIFGEVFKSGEIQITEIKSLTPE